MCGKIIKQQRQHRVGVTVRAQIATNVGVADERPQHLEVMAMDDRAHADAGLGVDLETRRGV